MNKIIFLSFLLFSSANSQTKIDYSKFPYPNLIQKNINNEKPGSYRQVVKANKTVIHSGGSFTVKYYITGYGTIDPQTTKLYVSPSAAIMDESKSMIFSMYGIRNLKFSNAASTITLEGTILNSKKEEETLFNDADKTSGQSMRILFENNDKPKEGIIYMAPITWSLTVLENTPPGDYYTTFVLTYYNGERWLLDEVKLQFTISTWWDEYSEIIQILSIITVILTFIGLSFSILKSIK